MQATHSSDLEERVKEAEERALLAEKWVKEAEERAMLVEEKARETEERAELYAQARVREAERRAHASEEKLEQVERQSIAMVEKREVHITEEILGGGSWGEVRVAKFRGTRVTAKLVLQATDYHKLFTREIHMAARIRHPNLVQFIGTCMEGGVTVMISELLLACLREELEWEMKPSQRLSIAQDVARALNYLHLMRPDPIVHHGVNSANVLLEPLSGQWKAKITFPEQLKSCTDIAVYAAPEMASPSFVQSPQTDIFSFGVLLVEMCTGVIPETSARESLIASIQDQEWVWLIRQCTYHSPHLRLSAAEVLVELQQRS